ncbi:DNA-directed DNA polymerase II small subunit [Halorientalis pallida]|uniref:DNA polymerase II small subunit n=1 Tax=Halorientalis pallida TaxID=2479928 RepID=A0A498KYI7_9EURY|nr:DNA-directed DNA polymerase II small subunit [Halorientalis pallida]RXK50409.1 DNA-directed DNA polymerase II small subunit [Halorientalis pallida]
MPLETPARIVNELAQRGYNADREAVTLLANADDPPRAIERALDAVPDDAIKLSADHVASVLAESDGRHDRSTAAATAGDSATETTATEPGGPANPTETGATSADTTGPNPSVSSGTNPTTSPESGAAVPPETGGSADAAGAGGSATATETDRRTTTEPVATGERSIDTSLQEVEIDGDMTGQSTGTGEYSDFVAVFRDRYERLSRQLRGRINHRPTNTLSSMAGGSEAAIVGMVSDIRSTASGHWLVELEDTNGVYPCLVMKDRDTAEQVDELLHDEVIAVEGTLSDDNSDGDGILFVDDLYFPEIPRTHQPSTADREVSAALVSDVHVGSQEFMADAWTRFADWLHTEEAERVEYLLLAGDMVEGVGVYPDQDEELDVVDIYDQYREFSEFLKEVPGDMEIVMIPGNHDAVRLAEPQPGFDEELRDIMSAHDCRITSNPSTVTVEGVSVLMYHGVSLDEVIAELPDEKANYDEPHKAMYQLLKKRHVAPQFGGHTRLAPEERDYLVIEETPDVFHAGHVHKFGYGKYHNVLTINSGCWQAQTAFQESVNIDPDCAMAPIVDLDTLDLTIRKFA